MKKRALSILLALVFILPVMMTAFAPAFAATPVARIEGGNSYLSLQDAVDAWQDGETLTLLKDITLESPIGHALLSGDSGVFDGGGHTISYPDTAEFGLAVFSQAGGSVEFKNLTIISEAAGVPCMALVSAEATLQNCTFTAVNTGTSALFVLASSFTTPVTIISGTFSASGLGAVPDAIFGSAQCKLGDSSIATPTQWQDPGVTSITVTTIPPPPSRFSGFTPEPGMTIHVLDESGNRLPETGLTVSMLVSVSVGGASFAYVVETKCTDIRGSLVFAGIPGMKYRVTSKDGKTADFEYRLRGSVTLTLK